MDHFQWKQRKMALELLCRLRFLDFQKLRGVVSDEPNRVQLKRKKNTHI